MGKKVFLWVLTGASFAIAFAAVCEQYEVLVDPFAGLAATFAGLMLVTRLIFDDEYQRATLKDTIFYYCVNAIVSATFLFSMVYILGSLVPEWATIERMRDPNTGLFQKYQDRIRDLERDSAALQGALEQGQVVSDTERQELLAQLEVMQAQLLPAKKEIVSVDTDDWVEYADKKLGYQFKYPKGWTVEEFELRHPDAPESDARVFRYVQLESGAFRISIGVKKESETNIQTHDMRTGIPSGDFVRVAKVVVGEGIAEKQYLYEAGFKSEASEGIQLIRFCRVTKPSQDIENCVPFSINKEVSAEVWIDQKDELHPSAWESIEQEVDLLLTTIEVAS